MLFQGVNKKTQKIIWTQCWHISSEIYLLTAYIVISMVDKLIERIILVAG